MKILIAPDKFKGSLSAMDVCEAIGRGLKKENPSLEVLFHPMADGGDGSLEILGKHLTLEIQKVKTVDPLNRPIQTYYYASEEAAFIEVASASGLVLLRESERNPSLTSTFGTGKMMADAIEKGFQHIFLFMGGSATNDGGMGIVSALGGQFLDKQKQILAPIGENLVKVDSFEPNWFFEMEKIKVTLLCDVTNPLFGPNGAAYVYAPQKGASKEQVSYLDNGLKHFSEILQGQLGQTLQGIPGIGAAGGIGAGLIAILGAGLKSGFDTISELSSLEEKIQDSDWVISGEGKLDTQSLNGKVIDGVAALCRRHRKPFSLMVGKNELLEKDIEKLGHPKVYSVAQRAKGLEDAMTNGAAYLEILAEEFYKQEIDRLI